MVPLRIARVRATGAAEVASLSLVAAGIDYPKTLSIPMVAGRWFRAGETGLSSCVVDAAAAKALFPGVDAAAVVGRTVKAAPADSALSIVGVLEDPMTYRGLFEAFDEGRGGRTLTGALLSFRNVYVPEDALGRGATLSMVERAARRRARVGGGEAAPRAVAAAKDARRRPRASPACSSGGTGWTAWAARARPGPRSATSSGS